MCQVITPSVQVTGIQTEEERACFYFEMGGKSAHKPPKSFQMTLRTTAMNRIKEMTRNLCANICLSVSHFFSAQWTSANWGQS